MYLKLYIIHILTSASTISVIIIGTAFSVSVEKDFFKFKNVDYYIDGLNVEFDKWLFIERQYLFH